LLEFPAQVNPVVIVDDATRPGGHVNRGRAFTFTDHVEGLVATSPCWLIYTDSPTGVIIDHISVCSDASLHFRVELFPAGADLSAFTGTFARDGRFIEACAGPTDLAPLFVNYLDTGFVIPATATPCFGLHTPDEVNNNMQQDFRIYLAPPPKLGGAAPSGQGGAMLIGAQSDTVTGRVGVNVFGRVY